MPAGIPKTVTATAIASNRVIVPATCPFSFSTVSAAKKKRIGIAATKPDSQRLPKGS